MEIAALVGWIGTGFVMRHQVICGLKFLVSGLNRFNLFLYATDGCNVALPGWCAEYFTNSVVILH